MKSYFTWQLSGDAFKVGAYISCYVAVAKANTRLYISAEIFQAALLIIFCYFFVKRALISTGKFRYVHKRHCSA